MKHNYKTTGVSLLLVLGMLLVSSCVNLKARYPEKRYFVLDAAREVAKTKAPGNATLAVRKLSISPRYERNSLVYKIGNVSFDSDFYNQFFIDPDLMITEEIRNWLGKSGIVKDVVSPSSHILPTYILEGSVDVLYGDFRASDKPAAVVEIRFFLIDDTKDIPAIVFHNTYSEKVPLTKRSPEVLVEGFNEALRRILTSLEEDLRKALLTQNKR